MPKGLAVSDVVNVTVTLSQVAPAYQNFGALAIAGSSAVIDTNERIRVYSSLTGVGTDFPVSSPEWLAADLFFSQSPQPAICYIARFAQTAVGGLLHGAILTPTQALLTNFTAVTSGSFNITIDGVPLRISGLNFSAAANMNGVASILQTAIAGQATGATVTWDSVQQRFNITSGTTGVTSSVSFGRTPTSSGNVVFTANPVAASTLTLNGTAITFVASGATGNQVNIGASLAVTLANLLTFLQTNPLADVQIAKFNSWVAGSTLYLESVLTGTGGAAYTLATTVTGATVSGSTLTSGTGTDVSSVFRLTSALGAPAPVNGIAAETPAAFVNTLANVSSAWYGLMFATATPVSDADHLLVAAVIEGLSPVHVYGVTTQDTRCLDSTQSGDLASLLMALGCNRTFIQYSSASPYAAASVFGRAFTVDFNQNNSVITLKFKQEPLVIAENLTENWAATLKAKNCNVFVNYQNGTAILQEGVMCGGYYIDERHCADWFQNRLQTDEYTLLYQALKIPQTDAGTHQLVAVAERACDAAVNNGMVAPGVWNVVGFGTLQTGDTLPTGYYCYAPPVSTQSPSDRGQRKSVPIQVALKLAGAIHSANLAVTINR